MRRGCGPPGRRVLRSFIGVGLRGRGPELGYGSGHVSGDVVGHAGRVIGLAVSTILLTSLLFGCSSRDPTPSATVYNPPEKSKTGVSASPRVVDAGQPVPRGGGSYKIGQPYQISGRWYFPRAEPDYDRSGLASWYGADFHGRRTANGEVFDMFALTAAHPTLPLPSYVYVTNPANGRTVLVRVNDRGPYAHDRVLDMSRQVAHVLGLERAGVGQVRVRYAAPAPLDGDDRRERQFIAQQPWAASVALLRPGAPLRPPMALGFEPLAVLTHPLR